jgi:hypothetical protein
MGRPRRPSRLLSGAPAFQRVGGAACGAIHSRACLPRLGPRRSGASLVWASWRRPGGRGDQTPPAQPRSRSDGSYLGLSPQSRCRRWGGSPRGASSGGYFPCAAQVGWSPPACPPLTGARRSVFLLGAFTLAATCGLPSSVGGGRRGSLAGMGALRPARAAIALAFLSHSRRARWPAAANEFAVGRPWPRAVTSGSLRSARSARCSAFCCGPQTLRVMYIRARQRGAPGRQLRVAGWTGFSAKMSSCAPRHRLWDYLGTRSWVGVPGEQGLESLR